MTSCSPRACPGHPDDLRHRLGRSADATPVLPAQGRPGSVVTRRRVDKLLIDELVDAERPEFATDAGTLGAAKGQFRATALGLVDPYHPDVEAVGHVQCECLVAAEDRSAQADALLFASLTASSASATR